MSPTAKEPEVFTNLFTETLAAMSGGNTELELHHKLKELIGHVRSTAKKGTITLTLTVKPGKGANTAQLVIEDDVIVKMPKMEREITVFFADDNNTLSRNDPRQPKLTFTPRSTAGVDTTTGEILTHDAQ